MTCKNDCLHYEACKSMLEAFGYTVDGIGENAAKDCKEFENKEDFVKVVRCKECAWSHDGGPSGLYCNHPDNRNPIGCNADDFCDCGIRKTTDIPVVRCKNCKHRDQTDRHWCNWWMTGIEINGFCYHGERIDK